MARKPISPEPTASSPQSPATQPVSGEVPLFHFGLRQLFWFIAVLCMLLGGVVSTDGVASLALLLAALVVAAHVFSTGLASRLRSDADRNIAGDFGRAASTSGHGNFVRDPASHRGRRSPWHGRGSTALPWLPTLVLVGVCVGGISGALVLALVAGQRISGAGVVVGSASSAILGGWLTFLGGSFYGIFRHGLHDALADQRDGDCRHERD